MCEADKTAHPAGFLIILLFAAAELYLPPAELTVYITGFIQTYTCRFWRENSRRSRRFNLTISFFSLIR